MLDFVVHLPLNPLIGPVRIVLAQGIPQLWGLMLRCHPLFRVVAVIFLTLASAACSCAGQETSASLPDAPESQSDNAFSSASDSQFNCVGSFPSDLTVLNCRYSKQKRFDQFITSGITDQAMLLSITGSVFTQIIRSPGEWPETWKYYGYRVGSSYTGSVGRASAEYIAGAIIHDDPRHVTCSDDPQLFGQVSPKDGTPFVCTVKRRFVHAFLDSVTVRHSDPGVEIPLGTPALYGTNTEKMRRFHRAYRRLPAFSRLIGVYGGAYAQYPWEPRSANTFGAVSQRAALSYGSTFLGSFYTEFGSSVFSFFAKKF